MEQTFQFYNFMDSLLIGSVRYITVCFQFIFSFLVKSFLSKKSNTFQFRCSPVGWFFFNLSWFSTFCFLVCMFLEISSRPSLFFAWSSSDTHSSSLSTASIPGFSFSSSSTQGSFGSETRVISSHLIIHMNSQGYLQGKSMRQCDLIHFLIKGIYYFNIQSCFV